MRRPRTSNDLTVKASGLIPTGWLPVIFSPNPVSMNINTFDTKSVPEEAIERAVNRIFSFKPADIIQQLDLLRPIYSKTTNYGHFGKDDPEITWERTDKAAELKKAAH